MGLELLEFLGISIASATVLIVVAKFVLQHLIRRAPDYYDKRELAEEAATISHFGEAGAHAHEEPATEPSVAAVEKEPDTEPVVDKPVEKPTTKKASPKKKPAEKKTSGKKSTDKKPAEKKTSGKKSTSKKPAEKKSAAKKSTGKKPRKPSMSMKKDELIAAAKERGIKLPEKVTKAQILELIEKADK